MTDDLFREPTTAEDERLDVRHIAGELADALLASKMNNRYDLIEAAAEGLTETYFWHQINAVQQQHDESKKAAALETIDAIQQFSVYLFNIREDFVQRARRRGATWREIGAATGLSTARAQQKWSRP